MATSTLTPKGQVTIPLVRRSGSLDNGLAGLVGLWDDGEEFAADVERVVANRTPPRPVDGIE